MLKTKIKDHIAEIFYVAKEVRRGFFSNSDAFAEHDPASLRDYDERERREREAKLRIKSIETFELLIKNIKEYKCCLESNEEAFRHEVQNYSLYYDQQCFAIGPMFPITAFTLLAIALKKQEIVEDDSDGRCSEARHALLDSLHAVQSLFRYAYMPGPRWHTFEYPGISEYDRALREAFTTDSTFKTFDLQLWRIEDINELLLITENTLETTL